MANIDDSFEFVFDDSDLELAIAKQTQDAVKGKENPKKGNSFSKTETNIGDVNEDGSTQEKLDGSDDLQKFFDSIERKVKDDDPSEYETEEEEEEEEETTEPEEGDEDQEEEEQDGDDEGSTQDDMSGDVLLDILRQEQLLYIPDDFEGELDAETLDYFKQQTRQLQQQELLGSIRSQYANDPDLLAEFDYFITGGRNANLPVYRNLTEQVSNYQNFDISSEDNQRAILEDFLKEGLDPNNPAHKLRLGKVKQEVDEIINNFEGETQAEEAKRYFTEKYEGLRHQEEQRVAQLKHQQQLREQQKQYEAQRWHSEFQQTLQQRNWNNQKKQAILQEQYSEVQMEDGSYAPVWYAKEAMIKADPNLYQVYLDWLTTNFDLETGTFRNSDDVDENTRVTRKILSMVQKKGSSRPKSGSTPTQQKRRAVQKITEDDLLY